MEDNLDAQVSTLIESIFEFYNSLLLCRFARDLRGQSF